MNNRDYLSSAVLYWGKAYSFISSAKSIKWGYAILHFMLIFCLLFLPVFISVVRTQPDQLYTRVFSQDFENAVIEYHSSDSFSPELISDAVPAVYVFDDFVVYADSRIVLPVPSEAFLSDELLSPFGEVFSMIAVYNMYIPNFLLPMLLITFLVLLILQLFFYLMSAVFLGTFRLTSTQFRFGERVKIVIMSSLFPAMAGAAVGFALPGVHIILFQMINLLMLFFLSNKYDKRESELLKEAKTHNWGKTV